MEYIQILHLFSGRDKLDRLVDHVTNRNGSTTSGITIQFGEDYPIKIESIVKGLRSIHCILTRHGVDYKKCFGWIERFFELLNLLHHRLIHRQTARGIDHNGFFASLLGISNGIIRYLKCVFIFWFGIHLHADLLAQYLELVDRRRAVDIAGHEQYLSALSLE